MRGKLRASTGRTGSSRITPAGAGKTIIPKHIHGQKTDHPRRCGENRSRLPPRPTQRGSPPQVRGKPHTRPRGVLRLRITPAGAGKTLLNAIQYALGEDHPRRCGENAFGCGEVPTAPGSPPQVRGKPCWAIDSKALYRITPAGAGKTQCQPRTAFSTQDHPRRCGENPDMKGFVTKAQGSPPQVRGKLWVFLPFFYAFRITPAGAGKTQNDEDKQYKCQDHPRRCGENFKKHGLMKVISGSPPQVRGKPVVKNASSRDSGITPAGAGKTLPTWIMWPTCWDHPRRCGENLMRLCMSRLCGGSPPQVRGKPDKTFRSRELPGITPAGAGKTRCDAARSAVPEDHPRRCGENLKCYKA